MSARTFNLTLCGTLAYGLIVNAVMVYYLFEPLQRLAASMGWLGLLLGYLVPTFAGVFLAARSKNPVVSFIGYNLVVLPIGLMLAW